MVRWCARCSRVAVDDSKRNARNAWPLRPTAMHQWSIDAFPDPNGGDLLQVQPHMPQKYVEKLYLDTPLIDIRSNKHLYRLPTYG